jgi:hypothetical protein
MIGLLNNGMSGIGCVGLLAVLIVFFNSQEPHTHHECNKAVKGLSSKIEKKKREHI